ncbi:MAG: hypothetical protein Kow0092_20560 [Deferrisomatales bacterium]
MSPHRVAALAACLSLVLCACSTEPPPRPPATAAAPAAAKPAPKAVKPARKEPPEQAQQAEPPAFVYDPVGLRDPFQPFIKLEVKKKAKPQVFVPKTPLQRYAVEELRLVGILWARKGRAKALIEDPEGKGYVVSSGTLVGDRGGKVIEIRPEKVVIEERSVDLLGEENVKVVDMTLRKPDGEVSP